MAQTDFMPVMDRGSGPTLRYTCIQARKFGGFGLAHKRPPATQPGNELLGRFGPGGGTTLLPNPWDTFWDTPIESL